MPEKRVSPFVTALIERQAGASDRGFARTLGVSVTRWCEVKAGDPPGLRFLQCAIAVYPDLALLATALLAPQEARNLDEQSRMEGAPV